MAVTEQAALTYKLSEEIVRWRFELLLRSSGDWWIAFSNPTGGPWKRLMGLDVNSNESEVYRFGRETDRPDIVAVSDSRKAILIIEAKANPAGLLVSAQVAKSSAVVAALSSVLTGLSDHDAWHARAAYQVVAGLLWGRKGVAPKAPLEALNAAYRAILPGIPLIGFETVQRSDERLECAEFALSGLDDVTLPLVVL